MTYTYLLMKKDKIKKLFSVEESGIRSVIVFVNEHFCQKHSFCIFSVTQNLYCAPVQDINLIILSRTCKADNIKQVKEVSHTLKFSSPLCIVLSCHTTLK